MSDERKLDPSFIFLYMQLYKQRVGKVYCFLMVKWKCTLEHDLQLLLNITDRHIRCTRLDSNFIFNLLRQRLYKSKSCPNVSHTAKSVVGQQRHVLHVSKILSHYQTVQEVIRQVGKSWTGAYMETKRPVLFCYVPRRDNVLLQKFFRPRMKWLAEKG